MSRPLTALLLCVLAASSLSADPSPAYLVADIHTGSSNPGIESTLVVANGALFFRGGLPETGSVLWKATRPAQAPCS